MPSFFSLDSKHFVDEKVWWSRLINAFFKRFEKLNFFIHKKYNLGAKSVLNQKFTFEISCLHK